MFSIYSALYILAWGAINRLRGHTFKAKVLNLLFGKTQVAVYGGLATWLLTGDYILAGIVAVGYRLWAMLGWGTYFTAFTGDLFSLVEKQGTRFTPAGEVPLIDRAADKIFKLLHGYNLRADVAVWLNGTGITGDVLNKYRRDAYTWGLLGMLLRGLCFIPLFMGLGIYQHNLVTGGLFLPAAIAQGVIYYAMRPVYKLTLSRMVDWRNNGAVEKDRPGDYAAPVAEVLLGLVIGALLLYGVKYA